MQAGKQNEILQKKLEELAGAPEGFVFDAAATWRRLEVKLKTPKQEKRFLPLYAAAVCLLIAALLLWNLSGTTIKNESVDNQADNSVSINHVKEKKSLQHASLKEPETTFYKKAQKNTKAIFSVEEKKATLPVAVSDTEVQMKENNLDTFTLTIADAETRSIVTAHKPKFRIAHINELNNGSLPPNAEQQTNKNNFVFAFHQPAFTSEDVTIEEKIYPSKKQKGLLGFLNTQ